MSFFSKRWSNFKWQYDLISNLSPKLESLGGIQNSDPSKIHLEDLGKESLLADCHCTPGTSENSSDYDDEIKDFDNLRRIKDDIPPAAWLIVLCELCERFTFYGVSGPFQNYIQFPPPKEKGDQPGALGQGQRVATALSCFFAFFCYITPILGAVIADKYIGKYRTILIFSCIYMTGLSILILTATPLAMAANASLPGLILAMIIIGFGTGGIKSNVSAMVAEQYPHKKPFVKTLETGEKVIIDPKLTVQSIFHWFYVAINIGALSPIITTNLEKYHSFWLAFLIPFLMFAFAISIFFSGRRKYIKKPPDGSIIFDAFRALKIAFFNGRNLDHASPSKMSPYQLHKYRVTWDDKFVGELRSVLQACSVFIFFPIFSVVCGQSHTNLISQGATMRTGFLPNDIMNNINPVTLIIFIPILDKWIYPAMRRNGIKLRPVTRVSIGFMFAASSMLYSAIIQWQIYNTGPCYENTRCIVDGKPVPNDISIWWQAPIYILIAISEAFTCITCIEYAFQKAPASMKSIATSSYLGMSGIGAALGLLVVPFSKDPYSIYIYIVLGNATFIAGFVLLYLFRDYDRKDNDIVQEPETKERESEE
ncbi:hypothetical protein G9A89_023285 [Geosiphon pyriformis]|nr:hypothetical protein G9A89_023285 [Geosiphon pyriformis]